MSRRPELHRGKIAKHPRVLGGRPLTREDLAVLRERRIGPPKVKQYRETHHRVARLVAAGLRVQDISRMTGYSPTRIGQFKSDPAFAQLVAEYSGKVDEAYVSGLDEYYETATSNMLRAERLIEARLDKAEDEDEAIPLQHLLSMSSDRADRFGYGKHSTQTSEVLNFASMMKSLAAKSGRSNVIDAPSPTASTLEQGGPITPTDPAPEPSFATGGFRRRIQGGQR